MQSLIAWSNTLSDRGDPNRLLLTAASEVEQWLAEVAKLLPDVLKSSKLLPEVKLLPGSNSEPLLQVSNS